jgi:hypothetical protein
MLLEDSEGFGRILMVHVNGKLYNWSPQFRASLKQIRPAKSTGEIDVWRCLARHTCAAQHSLSCQSGTKAGATCEWVDASWSQHIGLGHVCFGITQVGASKGTF